MADCQGRSVKIVCIGAGNVGWHLTHALDKAGHTIEQIVSRTESSAKALASKFGASFTNDLSMMYDAEVILIALPDDAIPSVLEKLPSVGGILAHTCGSHGMDVLKNSSLHYGIFYPLQSLTKGAEVNMLEVPLLVEGSNNETANALFKLADSISNKAREVNSEDRARYQLAAVVANNFSNFLIGESQAYLESQRLDFDLLLPLIKKTFDKLKDSTPLDAQTGPARRGDTGTIRKHLELLKENQDLLDLYKEITQRILTKYHPES